MGEEKEGSHEDNPGRRKSEAQVAVLGVDFTHEEEVERKERRSRDKQQTEDTDFLLGTPKIELAHYY